MYPKSLLLPVIALCVVPKRWYMTSQQFRPLDKWATYTITRKPCRNSEGKQGVCMFRWDCINMNGLMLSACMDGFLFGACCYIEHYVISSSLISQFSESETFSTNHKTDHYSRSSKDTIPDISYTKVSYVTSPLPLSISIKASPTFSSSNYESVTSDNASLYTFSEKVSEDDPEFKNSSGGDIILGTISVLANFPLYRPGSPSTYNASTSKTRFLTHTSKTSSELLFHSRITTISTIVMSPILSAIENISVSCITSDCLGIVLEAIVTDSINEPNTEVLYSSHFEWSQTFLEVTSYSTSNNELPELSHSYVHLEDTLHLSPSIYASDDVSEYTSSLTSIHTLVTSTPLLTFTEKDSEFLGDSNVDFQFLSAQSIQVFASPRPINFYTTTSITSYENEGYNSYMTLLPSTSAYLLLDSQVGFEHTTMVDTYTIWDPEISLFSGVTDKIHNTSFFDSASSIRVENLTNMAPSIALIESPSFHWEAPSSSIIPTNANLTSSKETYGEECGVKYLRSLGRIVGGKNTYFGKWPWQVLVKESAWLGIHVKNKCGGVLINSFYVLTAAHCQPGFLASLMVILGEHDLSNNHEELKPIKKDVKRMIVHREYNSQTLENDLALLELESAVEFQPHILPICLPERGEDFTDQMAFVTGWGKLSHGGTLPTVLQEVRVPIISNSRCQQMFLAAGHIKAIRDTFVCAGYDSGGQDSCEGDSGGPLMVQRPNERWVLVGTVSHGIRCADPNLPGVYMRTAAYRAWIDNIIKPKPTIAT